MLKTPLTCGSIYINYSTILCSTDDHRYTGPCGRCGSWLFFKLRLGQRFVLSQ